MGRVQSDNTGPAQRLTVLAIAVHEVGGRIASHSDTVTVGWAPAHRGAGGSEATGTWAMAAVERGPPKDGDPAYLRETSLSHMARRETEARSQATRDWLLSTSDPIDPDYDVRERL